MITTKKKDVIHTGKNQKAGIKMRYDKMEDAREHYELQQIIFKQYNQSILDGYNLTGRWVINEDFNLSKQPNPVLPPEQGKK